MRALLPFIQFMKREKHPWRSVTFRKLTLSHGCFSCFLNCKNSTKSRKASHIQILKKKNRTWGLKNTSLRLFIYYGFFVIRPSLMLSSHRRCSVKKGVLKNFAIFTGKHMCWSLFFIKLEEWRAGTWNNAGTVNITKFFITPILKKICKRLLLATIKTHYADCCKNCLHPCVYEIASSCQNFS